MQSKISCVEVWETFQEEKYWLGLLQLIQNITFQKYGNKNYILELVEAERNLMLWFQSTAMSVDDYTREFKSRVEVWKSAGMSPGATEYAAKIVVEEENIAASLIVVDKLK